MNKVAEIIRAEITAAGAMTFARFMDRALYCPEYGYYERIEDRIGHAGDFFTSVSVGSLFGELLACQFCAWIDELLRLVSAGSSERDQAICIIEGGAHDGRLALDILRWVRRYRPNYITKLGYVIIEPSEHRTRWQQQTLAEFRCHVEWSRQLDDTAAQRDPRGFRGIFFCNELLDALPVHVLRWDAQRQTWFEWGVTIQDDHFAWTRLGIWTEPVHPLAPPAQESAIPSENAPPSSLELALPDGFTTEVCPGAARLWRDAARLLQQGHLLALDYGLAAGEFFAPHRAQGTLRSYRHHRLASDVLAEPGNQDITAHVDFSSILMAGEEASARTDACLTQAQYLTRVSTPILKGEVEFGEWSAKSTRQFQTLTHPEHLGRAFRVLIQSRGLHTGNAGARVLAASS